MLDPTKLQQVQRLLAGGDFSQRQVARRAGVGRATVAAIGLAMENGAEAITQPVRCRGCGGLVFLPCRACALRRRSSGVRSER